MYVRIKSLLERMAVLPDHSPEWLDNPSVRVDLRAVVTEARALLQQPPEVKFVVTSTELGGGECSEKTREDAWGWLQFEAARPYYERKEWEPAIKRLESGPFEPGDVILHPLGAIFVVKADQTLPA